jgi:Na+/H+ antiporter NhaD/arsenite permease-like protein
VLITHRTRRLFCSTVLVDRECRQYAQRTTVCTTSNAIMSPLMPDNALTFLYRFGHSSSIALLASQSQDEQSDYAQGVKAFCIFNLVTICLWVVVLIVLKILGPSKVGCAAGGHVLDYAVLKKEYDRPTRKKIEKRSWRVQTAFFIAAVLLFVACGLFLNKGLLQVGYSLETLSDINHVSRRSTTFIQFLSCTRNMTKQNVLTFLQHTRRSNE